MDADFEVLVCLTTQEIEDDDFRDFVTAQLRVLIPDHGISFLRD